jgi:4a-hydroxytetrahydrobiopterin dehydratase
VSRPPRLGDADVARWVEDHPNWRTENGHLARFVKVDFATAVRILVSVEPEIERLDHHPRVEVGYEGMTIELWTHDRGGVTELDLALAARFDDVVSRVL